jgi:hypothetical protein
MNRKNKITKKKRIILHNNEALQLVSFHTDDPKEVKEWSRQGKKPILFDSRSWDVIQDKKWKMIVDDDSIVSIEYMESI